MTPTTKPPELNPNLILPVGTRVVTRVEVKTDAARALRPVGAVAEIVAAPADALHSYRVRFPDGAEASVRRREFSIWSQYREEAAGGLDPLIDHELFAQHVIYRCVVGSRAYGFDGPGSDTDRRGIYLPPADLHWSLYGVPEQLENPDSQECYWELQKFPVEVGPSEPVGDRPWPVSPRRKLGSWRRLEVGRDGASASGSALTARLRHDDRRGTSIRRPPVSRDAGP